MGVFILGRFTSEHGRGRQDRTRTRWVHGCPGAVAWTEVLTHARMGSLFPYSTGAGNLETRSGRNRPRLTGLVTTRPG